MYVYIGSAFVVTMQNIYFLDYISRFELAGAYGNYLKLESFLNFYQSSYIHIYIEIILLALCEGSDFSHC